MADKSLDAALAAFAQDLSQNDREIMNRVDSILQSPPRKVKELGFYGLENASDEERAFRATIFTLSNAGYIVGFEDKYITEMPEVMAGNGWIAQTDALGTYIERIKDAFAKDEEADVTTLAQEGFSGHVQAIEDAAQKAGKELLYIDIPLGDTLHFASVAPDVAERWQNTLFWKEGTSTFAVTEPQWDLYWDFLTYAFLLKGNVPSPIAAMNSSHLQPITQKGF